MGKQNGRIISKRARVDHVAGLIALVSGIWYMLNVCVCCPISQPSSRCLLYPLCDVHVSEIKKCIKKKVLPVE